MSSQTTIQPLIRYRPTRASMQLAATVAAKTGLAFDYGVVNELAGNLYERVYQDVVAALAIDGAPVFHFGGYNQARAAAVQANNNDQHVILDAVFEYWIDQMAFLATIATTQILDAKEKPAIGDALHDLFSLFANVNRFAVVKQKYAPMLVTYADCLNVSHALSRAIVIFVMCHEIAHHRLGHLECDNDWTCEYEADAFAVESFLTLLHSGQALKDTYIYLDPKIACAPLLLMQFFELHDNWLATHSNSTVDIEQSHPPAKLRRKRIEPFLTACFNETTRYLYDGLTHGMRDLQNLLSRL